jgi:hypothetical protein
MLIAAQNQLLQQFTRVLLPNWLACCQHQPAAPVQMPHIMPLFDQECVTIGKEHQA